MRKRKWRRLVGGGVAAILVIAVVWLFDVDTTTRPTRPIPDVVRLEPLTPVQVEGFWGYATADGDIVIAPTFNFVQDAFWEDRAYAQSSEGRGLIDRKGSWRAGPKNWQVGPYQEGRAVMGRFVGENFKWGYIDGDGNEVLAPKWDAARPFVDGVAQVGNEPVLSRIKTIFMDVNADIDWQYIDRDGKEVSGSSTKPTED